MLAKGKQFNIRFELDIRDEKLTNLTNWMFTNIPLDWIIDGNFYSQLTRQLLSAAFTMCSSRNLSWSLGKTQMSDLYADVMNIP